MEEGDTSPVSGVQMCHMELIKHSGGIYSVSDALLRTLK